MRVATFALVLSLFAVPLRAQTFQPTLPVTVDVLTGWALVGPITLTPETPGDELLFQGKLWRNLVVVAVLHPTKSGPMGVNPVPGVCVESALGFASPDVALTIADIDGDGKQDVIGTSPNGVAQVLKGIGLSACR